MPGSKRHLRFQLILPMKSGSLAIHRTLSELPEFFRRFPNSTVLFVENGTVSSARFVVAAFLKRFPDLSVTVLFTEKQGMGAAYRLGMQHVLKTGSKDDMLLLSAADLPFGFSDLDSFLRLGEVPEIAVGSKGHVQSTGSRPWGRRLATLVFRGIRRVFLSMRVADSQGTVFLSYGAAELLLPKIRSDDFFFSTELVYFAERLKLGPVEMPVKLRQDDQASTVRVVRDGARLVVQSVLLYARANGLDFRI